MSGFLFGLVGKWIILPSLVFKTALFLLLLLLNQRLQLQLKVKLHAFSAPKVWWWQQKKSTKINKKKKKKNQKIIKKHGVRIFACKPGSVLGYLITLLCTALLDTTKIHPP